MKILIPVLAVILLLPIFSNAACINISGDYDSNYFSEEKGKLIWKLRQIDCDSIATGFYYLLGDQKIEETNPVVNYTHKSKPELCEISNCFKFFENQNVLAYDFNGSIKVDGIYSCRYNHVEMSLDEGRLIRKFFIIDSSLNCKNLKTYEVVFKPIL